MPFSSMIDCRATDNQAESLWILDMPQEKRSQTGPGAYSANTAALARDRYTELYGHNQSIELEAQQP